MAVKIKQAVILAGGLGTRMRPLTETMPKPMIPMEGKPFLEHLIGLLVKNGVTEIILLLGYMPGKITEYFGDGKKFNVAIKYVIADVEDDTGTKIKKGEHLYAKNFLLLYCDNYWPLDLGKLEAFYDEKNVAASVVVYDNKDGTTKNNIFVDRDGYVTKYDKSRNDPDMNGVEAGFFILDKSILALAPAGDFNFEREILPQLAARRELAGYVTGLRYHSLGSIERLPVTREFFRPKNVVFLDRDGVINRRPAKADYVKKWEEFDFLPGAIDGLKELARRGSEMYLITNQPGIARGVMTKADLDDIHANFTGELRKHGVVLKGIYNCLHGWDDDCDCRKPKPGLLYQAANEHHFDVTGAVFIGDDERDVVAGMAAGCKTILMKSDGSLHEVVQSLA